MSGSFIAGNVKTRVFPKSKLTYYNAGEKYGGPVFTVIFGTAAGTAVTVTLKMTEAEILVPETNPSIS